MAITENNFTPEEFSAAVTANPELLNHVKTSLDPMGHRVIPQAEYGAFVDGERTRIASEKTREIYTRLDQDIEAETGIKKASAEEKTYDYNKRVFATFKEERDGLKAKIKDLEKSISEGAGDATLKAQLEAATAKLATLETDTVPGIKTQLFNKDVELQFRLALTQVKLKSDLPQVLLKPALEQQLQALTKMASQDEQGNILFKGADGKVILNKDMQPATALDVLSADAGFSELIDKGHQQAGAGSQAPGAGTTTQKKNADGNIIVIPSTVKTQVELTEFLQRQGVVHGTKDFDELFSEHSKNLPLR